MLKFTHICNIFLTSTFIFLMFDVFFFQEYIDRLVLKANNKIDMLYIPLENFPDTFTIGYFACRGWARSVVCMAMTFFQSALNTGNGSFHVNERLLIFCSRYYKCIHSCCKWLKFTRKVVTVPTNDVFTDSMD
jgi:hypothetical protein